MASSLQELDETAYWLELLVEGDFIKAEKLVDLQDETEQLIAIFVASLKTAKSKK
jgi:four helix bundle protein